MNIKEHIEAGHYPTDDKGRALVPLRGGGTATIYATDYNHDGFCICGMFVDDTAPNMETWGKDGSRFDDSKDEDPRDLMPPLSKTAPIETGKTIYAGFMLGAPIGWATLDKETADAWAASGVAVFETVVK